MIPLKFLALSSADAAHYRDGGADANGQEPERTCSDGGGNPCRHCFQEIPKDAGMLILAHRPFPARQPYAEVGPIFLCADPCQRAPEQATTPPLFLGRETMIARGYGDDDRIIYGTGRVIGTQDIEAFARETFADATVRFIHLRSSSDNCYHCRIERSDSAACTDAQSH